MSARFELHGARTGNCFRVAIALEEASLAYETVCLDLKRGDQRDPRHLALDPSGRVPVLKDHARQPAFVLTQSNAILFHISDCAPGVLLPEEPDLRIRTIERFFYFVTDVIAPSHAAFFLRSRGDTTGAASLARRAYEAMESAERFLLESPFMAGDSFTLADVAAVTIALSMADELVEGRGRELRRWLGTTRERPAVKAGMRAFDARPHPNRPIPASRAS